METVLSESEKINLAKIKKMEERCTRLELQISKEKRDLDDIKKQVFDLEQIPVNQAERVNSLKVELKRFETNETLRKISDTCSTVSDWWKNVPLINRYDRFLKTKTNKQNQKNN